MTFVLDAGPLVTIQRGRAAAAVVALDRLPILIPGGVWDELTLNSRIPPSQAEEMSTLMTSISGGRTDLMPGTPEAETYAKLYDPTGAMDEGESEVLALAIHRPDTIVVMQDRVPMHRALEELRGRVIGLHGFLAFLVENGLSAAKVDAVSKAHRNIMKTPPLWWNSVVDPASKK